MQKSGQHDFLSSCFIVVLCSFELSLANKPYVVFIHYLFLYNIYLYIVMLTYVYCFFRCVKLSWTMQNSGFTSLSTWSVLRCCRETNSNSTTAGSLKQHWTLPQRLTHCWTRASWKFNCHSSTEMMISRTAVVLWLCTSDDCGSAEDPHQNSCEDSWIWEINRPSSGPQCHRINSEHRPCSLWRRNFSKTSLALKIE